MAKAQLRRKRRSTAWATWSLFALAFGLLGYVAYVDLDAKIFQLYESRKLDQEIKAARAAPATIPVLDPTPASTARSVVPVSLPSDNTSQPGKASGEVIGRIEIPKVSLSVIIMEGTQGKTLRRGAGHIIGTALPGQTGNVGIAGHRDSFFRPLREVRKGDEVTLTTVAATYTYKVDSISVVDPSNVSVLEDSGGSILTLVTCFPFDFVGSAPQRFIVRAHRE